jgi:hypothetical protein
MASTPPAAMAVSRSASTSPRKASNTASSIGPDGIAAAQRETATRQSRWRCTKPGRAASSWLLPAPEPLVPLEGRPVRAQRAKRIALVEEAGDEKAAPGGIWSDRIHAPSLLGH